MIRPAIDATSGSWVIRTMVLPRAFSSSSMRSTSCVEWESRLPVGSSARITAGIRDERPRHCHALLLPAGQL